MTSFFFCPSVSQSSKRIDWSWSKVQHRLKDPIYLLRVHFLFNFSFNLFTIRSSRMANCTHFDRLDFAVHGVLLTSVGLAGLVANVLCLLVLHRPALRVGRQVSLKCRYIQLKQDIVNWTLLHKARLQAFFASIAHMNSFFCKCSNFRGWVKQILMLEGMWNPHYGKLGIKKPSLTHLKWNYGPHNRMGAEHTPWPHETN